MLKFKLRRVVALGGLCVCVALVAEPISADDAPADAPAETAGVESDTLEQKPAEAAESDGDVPVPEKSAFICRDGCPLGRSLPGPVFGGGGLPAAHGGVFRSGGGGFLWQGGPEGRVALDLDRLTDDDERYVVGLHCTPADETLRMQLGLEAGGLVVRRVVPEMPAALAGLREHDILVSIGDAPLRSIDDLMDAVQAAGDAPLTVTLLRGGEEQVVEMTPVKRASLLAAEFPRSPGERRDRMRSHLGDGARIPSAPYRLDAVGPGNLPRDRADALRGTTDEVQ